MDLPASVKAQRDVEDRAIKLGNERIELQGNLLRAPPFGPLEHHVLEEM